MEEALTFSPLLVVILLAFAVPLLLSRFRRLRLPIVVGEILAGVLIGRSGLGWVTAHDPVLDLLAEFGFVFLMFLAGMEIDFSSLGILTRKGSTPGGDLRSNPVFLGALNFSLTLVLSLLMAVILGTVGLTRNVLLMGLILSTTSLGVVVPVLKERGLTGKHFGQTLLISALIADFATILLITIVVAILSSGLTLDILLVGVLFVAFLLAYRLGDLFINRLQPVRRALEELSHATAQIKVRAAFTMMLMFVVLSEVLGTELILGAFLAGAIVSLLRTPEDAALVHQLDTIGYGFFIPIFFIMVGVDFNLGALLGSSQALLLVPVLLAFAVLVKVIPGLLLRIRFGWRETLAGGALLSARLSLIIAASAIGLRLNIINEATNAAIILIAALTSTLAPLAFNWILPPAEEDEDRQVVIFGATNLGIQVAQEVRSHGERVCFIEAEPRLVSQIKKEGFHVWNGDGDNIETAVLRSDRISALLALSADDERNIKVSRRAMAAGVDHVVALIHDPGRLRELKDLGVQTFTPAMHRATVLAMMARNADIYRLLTSTTDQRDIRELQVKNSLYVGVPLREIILPGDSLILAIGRDGEVVIPHGTTRLNPGDRLTILGDLEALVEIEHILEHQPDKAFMVTK